MIQKELMFNSVIVQEEEQENREDGYRGQSLSI
jgi:hypothetical protein